MAKKASSKATSTRKTSTPDSKDTPEETPAETQPGADPAPRSEDDEGAGEPERTPPGTAQGPERDAQPETEAGDAEGTTADIPEDTAARAEAAGEDGSETDTPRTEDTPRPEDTPRTGDTPRPGDAGTDTPSPEADTPGAAPGDDAARDIEDEPAEGRGDDDTPEDRGARHGGPAAPGPAVPEQVTVRKGGFVPMVLGGILAGAIGFGAGYYLLAQREARDTAAIEALRNETQQALQEQSDRISALSDAVEATEPPDLSGLRQGQSELQQTVTALSDRLDGTQETLTSIRERLTALEKRPVTEGASEEAIAAYESELKALQDAMAAQRAEIEKMTAEARQMEQNAEATEQATRRRAALSRIETALDTGRAYADAVDELQSSGVDVPEALSRMADDGVATLAELQESFPPAARDALAAARDAAIEAGEAGGIGDFLRTQLGVRSLEPREGDDPDAILSRAEAALRAGRLSETLDEIGSLPEVARAELTDWTTRATRRLDALAAVQELSEKLN